MKTILFTLMLMAPAGDLDEARSVYNEGTVLYEAADYEGAIAKFTAALNLVGNETDDDRRTRLSLLFNIAAAHEQQYSIDHDESHLRQALTLYERYRLFSEQHSDLGDTLDVEARVLRVTAMLDEIEKEPEPTRPEDTTVVAPAPTQTDEGTDVSDRSQKTGVGLVVAGSLATAGGVVLSVVGSQLEPRAQSQVDELADMGVPLDHPAWAEGQQFVEQERAKGRALLGTGVAVAVVGAVGIGVGSYYLVRAKKARLSVSPSFGGKTAGIQISGRF